MYSSLGLWLQKPQTCAEPVRDSHGNDVADVDSRKTSNTSQLIEASTSGLQWIF